MQRKGLVMAAATLLTGIVVGRRYVAVGADDAPSSTLKKPQNSPREETSPLACNLGAMTPLQRQHHLKVMEQLRTAVKEVKELSDGYAFRYSADPALVMATAEFITLESRCCPFFTFTLEVGPESGPIWLRVTGPTEAKLFIKTALS